MASAITIIALLGCAALAVRSQEQALRRHLRPADRARVAQFIASRRAGA